VARSARLQHRHHIGANGAGIAAAAAPGSAGTHRHRRLWGPRQGSSPAWAETPIGGSVQLGELAPRGE